MENDTPVAIPFDSCRYIYQKAILFLQVTKPERTMTNVLTAATGYLYASRWHINCLHFLMLLIGSTLIIASACVLNNLLDRGMDKKMARTSKRALVTGSLSMPTAIIFASLLGLAGFVSLVFTNWLTFGLGVLAFIGYVVLYDLAKRYTVHSTLIGTIPGGASLIAGVTAATGHLGLAAWLLFAVMAAWQMAHFYAISIYRHKDYAAAGLPVMSVKYGISITKIQIYLYILIFAFAAVSLSIFGKGGMVYGIVASALGLYWLIKAFVSSKADSVKWARGVFSQSLMVLVVLMAAISIAPLLP